MRSILVPVCSLALLAASALMLGVSASAQAAPSQVPHAIIKYVK